MTRFVALDRLRALAVVLMVQGHTFTALMRPDALPKSFMLWHGLVHGLTAPMFLFGAGLAFGIASYPRYASHHVLGAAFWKRMRRYALLVVIGYALQLPGASLLAAFKLRGDGLAPVLRVGPLHLIALCLGVCQIAALLIKSPRVHAVSCLVLGLAISIAAPHVYSAALPVGPFVRPWLDASTGSLFPIFPWASFCFFGVAIGGALALRRELPRALVWFAPGLLLAGTAYLLFLSGVRWSDPQWFWYASPLNTAFRIGLVLILLGVLHLVPAREPGWSELLARDSLVAYVAHLLLLYGTPFTPSLNYRLGLSLDAVQVTLVFAVVMGLTMLAVRVWASGFKERGLSLPWVRVVQPSSPTSISARQDDLHRAETAFSSARYEEVEVRLSDLEPELGRMETEERATYFYLAGMSAYRIGRRARARHALALCREEALRAPSFPEQWQRNLHSALDDLNGVHGAEIVGR